LCFLLFAHKSPHSYRPLAYLLIGWSLVGGPYLLIGWSLLFSYLHDLAQDMAPKAKVEQSRVDALRARVEQEVADALRARKADEMTAKIINDVNALQASAGAPPVQQSEIAKLRAQLLAGAPMLNFDILPPPGSAEVE
jgi:hypothetical protein